MWVKQSETTHLEWFIPPIKMVICSNGPPMGHYPITKCFNYVPLISINVGTHDWEW